MPFGQLVIGPPGSGKSTYCHGMQQFLNAIGRKPSLINLDPANDRVPYHADVDICDFITLKEVMNDQKLGPNGGVLYAMEQVEASTDEFINQIKQLGSREYLVIDCPGQMELFTNHDALVKVFHRLEKELDVRLVVVNLVDSHYLASPSMYISMLLITLRSMLQFNLPQVNVFSKIDLLSNYGDLPFRLEYYTQVQDLEHLYPLLEQEGMGAGSRYAKLTEAIAELVEEFGLVEFEVLAVEDKKSMIHLLNIIDKANGYLFGSTEIGGDSVWVDATRQGGHFDVNVDIHERWVEHKREYDAAEAAEAAEAGHAPDWKDLNKDFQGSHVKQ